MVDDLTDHGMEFIEKNKKSPFFLYLPFNTPHSPMQVPDSYWDGFKDKVLTMLPSGPGNSVDRTNQKEEAGKRNTRKEKDLDFNRAALAMVKNIDHNVGRIMAKLRKLYLEDDTIVIYLTDNGPNSFRWNGGMRGRKGDTDEGGVRSPFYVQWKDSIPEGIKIRQIASAIDVLPTLANLVGVPPVTAKPIDGKDLTALLFEPDAQWDDRMVYNYWRGETSVRTQDYRLDNENRLYDIENDRGQQTDIADKLPILRDSLVKAKTEWLEEVDPKTVETDDRPFTLGHPSYLFTQIPSRDGIPHGGIERSNKYPNDSFFSNWKNVNDSITWDVEVLADGHFNVELYYTTTEENIGAIVELSLGNSKIAKKITEVNASELKGMENDRVPRMESYVKDFKPMELGTIVLKKGKGTLTLKALEVPGEEVGEVRLLQFRKVE